MHTQTRGRIASKRNLAIVVLFGLLFLKVLGVFSGPKGENADESKETYNGLLSGDKVTLNQNAYGCPAADSLDKTFEYVRHGDTEAGFAAARDNGCNVFPAGLQATIEQSSMFHETVCLHEQGASSCFWFPRKAVEVISRN